MKRFYFLFVILAISLSCHKNTSTVKIEGDLYFKLIDFERIFDAPDSVLTKIEVNIRTIDKDTLKENDRKIYQLLEFMVDNNLLRKPFIRIRLDNGEIKMLFLDSIDYSKFKNYKLNELKESKKKIRIKAQVSEIKYDSISAFNMILLESLKEVDGKTEFTK